LLLLAVPALALAQAELSTAAAQPSQLVAVHASPLRLAPGERGTVTVNLHIASGWHVNSNPPNPDYLIPTRIDVTATSGLRPGTPQYPTAHQTQVGFDESPLSVYDGAVAIKLPLVASADVEAGRHTLKGTVHFQACDNEQCLAPASVPFTLQVEIAGGKKAAAESLVLADTTRAAVGANTNVAATPPAISSSPPRGANVTTGPPSGAATSATADNPIARALERGGWTAFLTLFLIGLALNLTPCVYPMLGVTVSVFGARRQEPPLKVVSFAVLYVLGMAVMYSTLGLVAAFTGGLFGGFLQSPIVLAGIGVLLIALSLSMFGLYEFQLPGGVLQRLGGTTAVGAFGTFVSGLVVGIFAAPCIGPPVVALLAIVGAKGDPLFGFTSFFTLSLGLGAPYLVLGTFSNLLQNLPRSGAWMVWVKKVFGVILLSVGAFYALLAFAPKLAGWVPSVALFLGGLYLGFVDKTTAKQSGFVWLKRALGAAAVVCAIVFVVRTPAKGIEFRPFTQSAFDAALRSRKSVMLDFSADWCVPCHELERSTFSDRRVIQAAQSFEAFRVDLTRYDSPESDRWRRQYGIAGVPTVVFLAPDGSEVRRARVVGFLPPDQFLERVHLATHSAEQASER
jgi:thiol:disulfide interchange protein DsbD